MRAKLTDEGLNALFAEAYQHEMSVPFHAILAHSDSWVTAHRGDRLVGFVNIVWDGLYHAFLLDRTACDDPDGSLKAELVVRALDTLRADFPAVTKVHLECVEGEVAGFSSLGFQRVVAGRLPLVRS